MTIDVTITGDGEQDLLNGSETVSSWTTFYPGGVAFAGSVTIGYRAPITGTFTALANGNTDIEVLLDHGVGIVLAISVSGWPGGTGYLGAAPKSNHYS